MAQHIRKQLKKLLGKKVGIKEEKNLISILLENEVDKFYS